MAKRRAYILRACYKIHMIKTLEPFARSERREDILASELWDFEALGCYDFTTPETN